jgi:hypothetical protein
VLPPPATAVGQKRVVEVDMHDTEGNAALGDKDARELERQYGVTVSVMKRKLVWSITGESGAVDVVAAAVRDRVALARAARAASREKLVALSRAKEAARAAAKAAAKAAADAESSNAAADADSSDSCDGI